MWEVYGNLYEPQSNPNGYVSLGLAENSLMHDVLLKHIHANLKLSSHSLTYGDGPTGSKRLKRALARFLTKHLKSVEEIQPGHIAVTNGCGPAIEHLSWILANLGDGFLLGQPWYGSFIPDISLRPGVEVVPVPFGEVDPVGVECVKKYEDAILKFQAQEKKVKGLMLCHPHNPLGRCYSRETLVGLMRLCEKYDLHLVSDEIYALSVFENQVDEEPAGVPFESVLSIDPKEIIDPARLHVVWGMSKDFGANGLRLGAIISQHNPQLHDALIPPALYTLPSAMSDLATANVLEDDEFTETYIKENRRKLSSHHKIVATWAKSNNIEYKTGVNAAFFLWVNLGKAYRDRHEDVEVEDINDFVNQLLLKHRVFLASGAQFGAEEPGWFRIVFSNLTDLLQEGLERVILALDDPGQSGEREMLYR